LIKFNSKLKTNYKMLFPSLRGYMLKNTKDRNGRTDAHG